MVGISYFCKTEENNVCLMALLQQVQSATVYEVYGTNWLQNDSKNDVRLILRQHCGRLLTSEHGGPVVSMALT